MTMPLAFSLVFYVSFAIYFFFGLYVLFLNVNSNLHRVFLASCISLCFWAFSFSIANSAADYETCLFWRRAACLGWGTYFSILLHFILIMTNHNRLRQKKWLYALLYLPAAITVFVFGLGPSAEGAYHLYYTEAGWVNIPGSTIWDSLFNLYYVCFSAMGVGLVLHWGIASKDGRIKKQSLLMGAAYIVAVLSGTLTEFVITFLHPGTSVQVAPIITLLPMMTIIYCIKRYQFLAPENKSRKPEAGQILSEEARAGLYRCMLLVYCAGALISFAVQYFSGREPLISALLFSTVMLILGFGLYAVQQIKGNPELRDILSDIVMAVTIPVVVVKYLETSAFYALTVPVVFILASVTFNRNRMLILTGTVTLSTLVYLWIIRPAQTVGFEFADHLTRIFVFLIIFCIACVINHIYRKRLIQYEEQVRQQELIAEISSDFINADERNIDTKINSLIQRCGGYFRSDHVYIIFFDKINKEINLLYEWRGEGIKSIAELIVDAEGENLPVWLNKNRLTAQGLALYTTVEDMEPGLPEAYWLGEQKIKTILSILLVEKEEVAGFFAFHAVNDWKIKEYSTPNMVKLIGNHVTHSLLKVAAEKELSHMAYFDTLTDIPNRMLFNKRLEKAITMAAASGKLVGLIYLDLDLFKTVNDIMGHDVGDNFLKQVAKNLSSCLKYGDTLARFGGDEFLISIPQAGNYDEIMETANRILEMFSRPIHADNHEFSVTASMGISIFPVDGQSPEELVKNADLAMYCSKEYGKNKYTVCSDELKKDFVVKTELTNSLYHALEKDELELYYQPKVKSNGEIIGVEALVRWNHPKRGLILPDEFITIAESIGMISAIDQWVVKKACRQARVFQDKGIRNIKMAFNLSPAQFYRESFLDSIKNALKENELDPTLIEAEITESIAYYRPEVFMKILKRLKQLGLSVAIDDFGSDYSSLSRLRSLPIDRIKIDRQFTEGIPFNKKQGDIVKAILALGNILGLKVTVEGVETEQQFEFFKENYCDEIQGYYFYRPMPAQELESLLKSNVEL